MLCRRLRVRSWPGAGTTLVLCLALTGGLAVLPPVWLEDETPALAPAAHDIPLTAVAEGSGVRLEKQAQSPRLVIRRPERGARLSSAGRVPRPRPFTPTTQAFRSLPRRQLYAAGNRGSSPDDPSDWHFS